MNPMIDWGNQELTDYDMDIIVKEVDNTGTKYDQQKHSLPKYVMETIKPVSKDLVSSKLFLFIMIFTSLSMMYFYKKLYNIC